MKGFPIRHSRAAFGPTYKDERKVMNPETDLPADVGNLSFHQLAGMNLLSSMAFMAAHWSGSAMVVDAHAEAWNPKQIQIAPYDVPTPTRASTGVYQIQYNATYPDMDGDLVAIDVRYPRGVLIDYVDNDQIGMVRCARVDARTIDVRVFTWDTTGGSQWALADRAFVVFWG